MYKIKMGKILRDVRPILVKAGIIALKCSDNKCINNRRKWYLYIPKSKL